MSLQDDGLGAWCAPGGAVPVQGETTWSFLLRVAVCYGLEVGELLAWGSWLWVNPVTQSRGHRPDGEVLLNVTAQAQVAAWAGVPAMHLARALPSWTAGPVSFGERARADRGWARWRVGEPGMGAGVVRLPAVCRPAQRPGAAGMAVRTTVESGVFPAQTVAAGRRRWPRPGVSGRGRVPGAGCRPGTVAAGGPAGGEHGCGAGFCVRGGAGGGVRVVAAGSVLAARAGVGSAP